MDFITQYNQFADQIDQCNDEKQLDQIRKETSTRTLQREFWKMRRAFFNTDDAIEKKKARIKQQWLQQNLGCSIPLKRTVKKFNVPYGMMGIVIDPEVIVDENCTIFPNVSIIGNTLIDSENHGFPTIGQNVCIGTGTVISGNVVIGENSRIDANCCVTFDVPAGSHVVNNGSVNIVHRKNLNNEFLTTQEYLDRCFNGISRDYGENENLHMEAAKPEDIDAIMQLYKDRIHWFKWKGLAQWRHYLLHHPMKEFLDHIKNHNYYLIKDGEEILAGFVVSNECENWDDPDTGAYYLSRAVIKVGCKNMGCHIVKYAKEIAIKAEKKYLRLECVYGNDALNQIWEKQGFVFVRDVEADYHASLREIQL